MGLGDYRQAIHDCDMAIQLNPRNSVAYYNRGNAHAFLGDHKDGRSSIMTWQ